MGLHQGRRHGPRNRLACRQWTGFQGESGSARSGSFSGAFPQTAQASASFTLPTGAPPHEYIAENCQIVCFLQEAASTRAEDEVHQAAAAYVTDLGETGAPALGAAAFTSSGRIDMAATGVRRLGENTAATSDDRWHIGSNTKAMTAAVLGRLADKAQVTLDTTLADAFPAANLHPDYQDVTLADLLSHTGGTPADTPDVDDAFLAMPVTEQRAAAVELTLTEAPEVTPHTVSRYSNLGYI